MAYCQCRSDAGLYTCVAFCGNCNYLLIPNRRLSLPSFGSRNAISILRCSLHATGWTSESDLPAQLNVEDR